MFSIHSDVRNHIVGMISSSPELLQFMPYGFCPMGTELEMQNRAFHIYDLMRPMRNNPFGITHATIHASLELE